jgi:FkbM family methyltransferase
MCVQDLIDAGYKIRWLNLGPADQSGVMSFRILDRDDNSTFLPREQLSPSRIADEKMVQVKTLNDIVSTYGLPTPDLVKIDAEGFDLKVIQGLASSGKTEVFLFEAGVTCSFENSVARAVTTMEALGYRLIDIRSPKHNVFWLTELAFLRHTCRYEFVNGSFKYPVIMRT